MVDNVYCTVSQVEQANAAIARMQLLGFRPEEVIVANQPSDVEALTHTEAEMTRSTLIGVAYGFIAGFLLGILNLVITGHGVWSMWGVPLIPIFCGLCWSLVGSIIGCSGLLVTPKVPAKIAHRLEEEVAKAKLVVTVPLHDSRELPAVRNTLLELGASDIFYTGDAA
jgi:hypothetical protein